MYYNLVFTMTKLFLFPFILFMCLCFIYFIPYLGIVDEYIFWVLQMHLSKRYTKSRWFKIINGIDIYLCN